MRNRRTCKGTRTDILDVGEVLLVYTYVVSGALECRVANALDKACDTLTEDDYNAITAAAVAVHDSLPTEASGTNGAPLDGYKFVKITYFEQ